MGMDMGEWVDMGGRTGMAGCGRLVHAQLSAVTFLWTQNSDGGRNT